MDETRQKNCRYCGKSLPEEAIFCYYCKRELVTRPERPASEPQPIKLPAWIWIVVAVLIVVVVATFLLQ